MSIIQQYIFNNLSNYTLSNCSIGSTAQLAIVPYPSQSYTQGYSTGTGFAYDPTKATFTGAYLTQLNQVHTPSFTDITLCSVSGSTVTKTGGTGYNGGVYSSDAITTSGTISFQVGSLGNTMMGGLSSTTPTWSFNNVDYGWYMAGANVAGVWEFGVQKYVAPGSYTTSDVYAIQIVSGTVQYLKNGTVLYTSLTTPTGPYYFMCSIYTNTASMVNITVLNTAQYLSSNITTPTLTYSGLGSIQALTGFTTTETGSPAYTLNNMYYNGTSWVSSSGVYSQANPKSVIVANLSTFPISGNTVQLAVVFNSGSTASTVTQTVITYTGQQYSPNGYILPSQPIQTSAMSSYSETETLPSGTGIQACLKVNGIFQYWNGSAWVVSDGSYSQSNTASVIAANISSLSLGSNSTVYIKWNLNTTNPLTTPTLTESDITYNFGQVISNPNTCSVYGRLINISGQAEVGAILTFTRNIQNSLYTESGDNVVLNESVSVSTDINGEFIIPLIYSSQLGTNNTYNLVIKKGNVTVTKNSSGVLSVTVPDAAVQDITNLLVGA